MSHHRRRFACRTLACATGIILLPVTSFAEVTKAQCVAANSEAQTFRKAGELFAAEAQLLMCASEACPAIVRNDCIVRLDELQKVQPTVVFDVKDHAGEDLHGVRIELDGHPMPPRKDGAAVAGDIGSHVFTITAPGYAPVTRTLVLSEGEKGRHERVELHRVAGEQIAAVSSGGAEQIGMGPRRAFGLVAGAVGVAGVALGGVFGGLAIGEKNKQMSDCTGNRCQDPGPGQSDHARAVTDGTISTAAFATGGALVVGGALLFFIKDARTPRDSESSWVVVPSAGPGSASVLLRGEF